MPWISSYNYSNYFEQFSAPLNHSCYPLNNLDACYAGTLRTQFGHTCHTRVFLLKKVFRYHYMYPFIPTEPGTLLSGYHISQVNVRSIYIRYSEHQNMNIQLQQYRGCLYSVFIVQRMKRQWVVCMEASHR